jgi:hypothetical protein
MQPPANATPQDRQAWLTLRNLEVHGGTSQERDRGRRGRVAIENKYQQPRGVLQPTIGQPEDTLVTAAHTEFQTKFANAYKDLPPGEQFDIQHNLDRMVPGTNYTYRMYMDNPAAYGGESGRPLAGPGRGRQAAPDNTALGQQALKEAQQRANERLGGAGRFEEVTRPTFRGTGEAIDVRTYGPASGAPDAPTPGGTPPGGTGSGGTGPGGTQNGGNGVTPTDGSAASQLQEFADKLAGMQESRDTILGQLNLRDAEYKSRQQLLDERRVDLQALTALQQPGVGLLSLFTQRRQPDAQVPLPPDLGALLRGQTVPAAGIIGGAPTFLSPDELTPEVFRDALRNVTAQNYEALKADPTSMANFISFGNLAGADPLRALQNIRATLPSARDVQGSILDTQYRAPRRL